LVRGDGESSPTGARSVPSVAPVVFHLDGCSGRPPTVGCAACIALARPRPRGARRARSRDVMELFASGEHPATHVPVDRSVTCGTCAHCVPEHRRFRCDLTRRTFVRLGWPGCVRYQ
jgi:hypothetical protein